MRKVIILFLACMLTFSVQASGKKRRVSLRASSGCIFSLNRSHRCAARFQVDVARDDDYLYVQPYSSIVATVSFLDEEGKVLSQQVVVSDDSIEIPANAVMVVVSYGDVSLVGILS